MNLGLIKIKIKKQDILKIKKEKFMVNLLNDGVKPLIDCITKKNKGVFIYKKRECSKNTKGSQI